MAETERNSQTLSANCLFRNLKSNLRFWYRKKKNSGPAPEKHLVSVLARICLWQSMQLCCPGTLAEAAATQWCRLNDLSALHLAAVHVFLCVQLSPDFKPCSLCSNVQGLVSITWEA